MNELIADNRDATAVNNGFWVKVSHTHTRHSTDSDVLSAKKAPQAEK